MANDARFIAAHPFQDDVLSLPVADLDGTSEWYTTHFGMTEVERTDQPVSRVILERDDARIGFAVNGGDASQDGAANSRDEHSKRQRRARVERSRRCELAG